MSILRTSKIPPTICPLCGASANRVSIDSKAVPKPGSIVICIECGSVNQFNQALALTRLSDKKLAEFRARDLKFDRDLTVKLEVLRRARGWTKQ
jgi:hypothetical protein